MGLLSVAMEATRRTVPLGPLAVSPLAVGTWAWGDRSYWGHGERFADADLVDAFIASAEAGLTFFDTAEVYGKGESEKIVGYLARKWERPLVIATKYAPLSGRAGAASVAPALSASLARLKLPKVDLYQLHWPDPSVGSVEELTGALADELVAGRAGLAGVSNYGAEETRRAHAVLAARGLPLASNQIHYSLLHRACELDGTFDACRELGVTILAYTPLEQGILAGRYPPGTRPPGTRGQHPRFSDEALARAAKVVELLREIGARHGDFAPEQVALAWLMARPGVIPIVGATSGAQATKNAGTLALTLDPAEIDTLDHATRGFVVPRRS